MVFWGSKSGIQDKYSLSASPTFTSEPWSVYTGRPKVSTGTGLSKVSVFVFDKKQYENYLMNYGIIKSRNSAQDKRVLNSGYDVLRDQVSNLAKLKHPNVLTLIEALEEHSKNFMFVTEFLTGSLESVFLDRDEEQNILGNNVEDNVVIHGGIYQLVHALDFMHNRASSVHLDIQPKTIFINENSDWKISGLGHLLKLPAGTNTSDYDLPHYDPRIPSFMHLDLNYTAPEIVLDSTVSFKSDYFSLGLLIAKLYSGENILNSENSSSQYKDEYAKFERKISTMSWDNVFIKLPQKLRSCIPMLMNRDIYSRYDNIVSFLQSDFFQNPMIKTLNFLDDLPTKSNDDKLVFLEGLQELLPNFPVTLLQRKFLTVILNLLNQLCVEKTLNGKCISFCLNIIINIGSTLSQLSFQEKILPVITNKTNFEVLNRHATSTLIDNLGMIRDKVKQQDFLEVLLKPILNFVFKDLEGDIAVVPQEKMLEQMTLVLDTLDFLTVKKFFLPLLSNLFTKTTSLKVKSMCVTAFKVLIERKTIDSYTCCEEILPLFRSMKSRDPRILVKTLSFFEIVPTIIDDESVLVGQLLPLMWNYSMAETLNASQFQDYTKVINSISTEIQRRHMEQLKKSTESLPNGKNDFKRIIESSSNETLSRKPEADQAFQSKTPAIVPTRKQQTESTLKKSAPMMNVTPATPKINTPTQIKTSSSQFSTGNNSADGFNDFVSSTSSPSAQRITTTNTVSYPALQATQPVASSSNNMTSKPTIAPSGISYPPGFSVPIQPKRQDSHTNVSSKPSTFNMNTDSLI